MFTFETLTANAADPAPSLFTMREIKEVVSMLLFDFTVWRTEYVLKPYVYNKIAFDIVKVEEAEQNIGARSSSN